MIEDGNRAAISGDQPQRLSLSERYISMTSSAKSPATGTVTVDNLLEDLDPLSALEMGGSNRQLVSAGPSIRGAELPLFTDSVNDSPTHQLPRSSSQSSRFVRNVRKMSSRFDSKAVPLPVLRPELPRLITNDDVLGPSFAEKSPKLPRGGQLYFN